MMLKQYLKENKPLKIKKGLFSTAFIFRDKVIIETKDQLKECLAYEYFPDSIHIPTVSFSKLETNKPEHTVYEMPLYQTARSVRSLICVEDYNNLYLPLRELFLNCGYSRNAYNWQDDFIIAANNSKLSAEYKELIIGCYEACMNYSHRIRFEISPRNVAANNDKRLILLDCFYINL